MTMTMTTRRIPFAFAVFFASARALAANGNDWQEAEAPPPVTAPPTTDAPGTDDDRHDDATTASAFQRPFAYVLDPSTPGTWHVATGYTASYATTEGAARPLAALS